MNTDSVCADCAEQLAHCHETLVIHTDGDAECFDGTCTESWEEHAIVATCTDLNWICACQKTGDSLPHAA